MTTVKYSHILFFLLLGIAGFLNGCAKVSAKKAVENERKSLIISQLNSLHKNGSSLLEIQSVELLSFTERPVFNVKKSFAETTKTGIDYSQISTMFDGFGNKTETRSLSEDTLVRCVILKTSVSGQKQALVFGRNGEVKNLSGELLDKALIASGSSIADAVGIIQAPFQNALPKTEQQPAAMNYVPYNQTLPENMSAPAAAANVDSMPESEIVETAKTDSKPIETISAPPAKVQEKPPPKIKMQLLEMKPVYQSNVPAQP